MEKYSSTPDENSNGFLNDRPESLRYEFKSTDPDDVAVKISKLLSPNTRVLDVGCGTGVNSEIIQNLSEVDLIGLEPDSNRVQKARERGINVHLGLLDEEFIQVQKDFDYILFIDVLEHLENPSTIIKIAMKSLKPGGSIIASVPNVAHWFVRFDLIRGRFDYQDCGIMDATHLRWFTKKTIINFFETHGLKIVSVDYTINIALPDYINRKPWKWIPTGIKKQLVKALAFLFPKLFGCQFIVKASHNEQ
jgi:methionine biosynthesis protein MetW